MTDLSLLDLHHGALLRGHGQLGLLHDVTRVLHLPLVHVQRHGLLHLDQGRGLAVPPLATLAAAPHHCHVLRLVLALEPARNHRQHCNHSQYWFSITPRPTTVSIVTTVSIGSV